MKNIIAIAKKEFYSYFNSPIAYLSITVFWVVVGILFFMVSKFFENNEATLRPLFEWIPVLFVFFIPAISMRLFAEEKKTGTIELLVTLPVSDSEIILGKLFGSLGFLIVTLILTFIYPILISILGNPDFGMILGGYIGLIFIGAAFLSIGIMTSTWTKNQIIAFILSLLFCSFFFFIDKLLSVLWEGTQAFFNYLSFNYHFENISRGVIDTRNIVYYLSVTVIALLIANYSLKSRNWK